MDPQINVCLRSCTCAVSALSMFYEDDKTRLLHNMALTVQKVLLEIKAAKLHKPAQH